MLTVLRPFFSTQWPSTQWPCQRVEPEMDLFICHAEITNFDKKPRRRDQELVCFRVVLSGPECLVVQPLGVALCHGVDNGENEVGYHEAEEVAKE